MSSVWLTPPRPPRGRAGQTRSRDQVAAAAVELADAGGLDAVTMRSVAEKLGISAMSLYWYVDSKAQIIELMVDVAFREQPAPRGRDWRGVLRSLARGHRRRLLAHPWLTATYDRPHQIPSPGQLDLYERFTRALTRQHPSLTTAQITLVYSVLDHLVAGHATWIYDVRGREDVAALSAYLGAIIGDGRHPEMQRRIGDLSELARDRFDDELEVVLDGLAGLFGERAVG